MKKSIAYITLFLTLCGIHAQNQTNSISVQGKHEYAITPTFTAKMVLSLANVYYDAPDISIDKIESDYNEKLAQTGIDMGALTKDDLTYLMMGYDKDGTVLVFNTDSVEALKKFLSVRSLGVSKNEVTLTYELSDKEMASHAKAAYDNAKSKAEAIAAKIGKKVGDVMYISDQNENKTSEAYYYGNQREKRDYRISVSFELL